MEKILEVEGTVARTATALCKSWKSFSPTDDPWKDAFPCKGETSVSHVS